MVSNIIRVELHSMILENRCQIHKIKYFSNVVIEEISGHDRCIYIIWVILDVYRKTLADIIWATSFENVSLEIFDQVTFKPACSATETN